MRTLGLSESGAPKAAALVSEEDAPLDRRTKTLNVANDLAAGDRIKFDFLDELDMKIDNAEIKALYKVLSRRRRTSKLYPDHLRCRTRVQVRPGRSQFDQEGHQRYHVKIIADKKLGRKVLYSDEKFRRIATAAQATTPPPQTTMTCLPCTCCVRRSKISTAVQARPRPTRRRRLRRRRRRLPTRTSNSKAK